MGGRTASTEPRQVFEAYERTENQGIDDLRFCPRCATECTLKEMGGRLRPTCPECGHVQYRNPSVGVCVMIVRDGKILLGRRSGRLFKGKWALPGGFMEFDEDFLTATRREAKEETGLDVEITSILNVATNYLTRDLHTLSIVCVASPVGGDEAPDDDISELRWVDMEGPFPPMAYEADEHIIRRYRETGDPGVPADPRYGSE